MSEHHSLSKLTKYLIINGAKINPIPEANYRTGVKYVEWTVSWTSSGHTSKHT